MKSNFSISSRRSAVYRGFSALTSEASCSSHFMKTSPVKTHFQMCPFSASRRSEKSRTPPDRSATPYYVESFRFQPGFIERKFEILKIFAKTLTWSQFSGLTAANKNNALLILWKPTILKHVEIKKTRSKIPYNKTCLTTPIIFLDPCCWKNVGIPKRSIRIS